VGLSSRAGISVFGVQCSIFIIKISNTEHRTPNVEMKLECLNVKVIAALGIFTRPSGNGFSLRSGKNAQPDPFGRPAQ